MSFVDKTLTCANCGAAFTFTSEDQEFHASRGFRNEPRRCPNCRQARRDSGGDARADREMFEAVCATCGKVARVPFRPSGDRPVYCSDCFQNQPRPNRGGYGGDRDRRW